jgi:hypothetical protein
MLPHANRLLLHARFGRENQALVAGEQQLAGLRTGIFEQDVHQCVDQVLQHNLARDGLRGLGDRQQIQLRAIVGRSRGT